MFGVDLRVTFLFGVLGILVREFGNALDVVIVQEFHVVAEVLQANRKTAERASDGKGGRRQELPQHHRDELALAGGQSIEHVTLQVGRDGIVQVLLLLRRQKLLSDRHPVGERDVLGHLLAQRTGADRRDPLLELHVAGQFVGAVDELLPK